MSRLWAEWPGNLGPEASVYVKGLSIDEPGFMTGEETHGIGDIDYISHCPERG